MLLILTLHKYHSNRTINIEKMPIFCNTVYKNASEVLEANNSKYYVKAVILNFIVI